MSLAKRRVSLWIVPSTAEQRRQWAAAGTVCTVQGCTREPYCTVHLKVEPSHRRGSVEIWNIQCRDCAAVAGDLIAGAGAWQFL